MKKFLTLAIFATVACIVAANAYAAQETITITATVSGVQGISITPLPLTWNIGAIGTDESRDNSSFSAENTGSVTETLEMSAASTGDFILGNDAGEDQIAIWGKCASTDPGLTIANALSGTSGQRSENLDPTDSLTVWMKYKSPKTITGNKSDGSATVTVSTAPAQ